MKNKCFALLICVLGLLSGQAMAKPLELAEVLATSDLNYPKIQAAIAKQEAAAGKTQEANGAFDLRLDGEVKTRGSGYYDGDYTAARIVKPVPFLGAEVYSGYRYGRGDFPIYDEYLRTRDQGEVNFGVVFSLLRNRDLDERRFKVQDAAFNQTLAVLDLRQTRLLTQLKAMHSYGEWIAAGQILNVYRDLLALAETRQSQLTARVKAGDAASITATENQQNLLKRQALLNEAQRDFTQKSNNLSLFWRSADGLPQVPSVNQVPASLIHAAVPDKDAIHADIDNVIQSRPELQSIAVNIDQQHNRLRLSENTLLPKVDLGLEMARDQGDGLARLGQTEGIATIKLSVPLERDLGNGQQRTAQAELQKLRQEQRLLNEQIRTELQNIAADLTATQANYVLSQQEVTLAEKMQAAEKQLFANGSSNLFLVNNREEKTAEARIKNILSNLYVFKSLGSYYAATVQFNKLGITHNNKK